MFPFGGNWDVFESLYDLAPRMKEGDYNFVSLKDVLG